ncbi:MAG: type II toxin-antitoxin system RelE/ParE family toxin [Coriobacteriia bacterium]|nr:type II toxin-antitoxin system RelE/ParE family toxin [Coriobacteriia bacterium]MCL2750616.1 type II toxin-antitoxin system RelE/ParE family toxin [Coriobacteriia bacterium]
MYEVKKTTEFEAWFTKKLDVTAKARISIRIDRIMMGNLGDSKSVGYGVTELRIDFGPGYRLYYAKRGKQIILLLIGGDKSTQSRDIELAKKLSDEYE